MKDWFARFLTQQDSVGMKTSPNNAHLSGAKMEQHALAYLKAQGLKHKCSNYRIRGGEIDLIMQDVDTLVFVEVKYRRSHEYGSAKEAITVKQQQRIRKAAEFYLLKHHQYSSPECRFDALCIDGDDVNIEWLKNAF